MKKLSKNIIILSVVALVGLSVVLFYSFKSPTVVEKQGFSLVDLLERDKDLSYDEFLKLQVKFDQLKADYSKDSSNYESLLKIAEIYIYEARVTGEHPYYYSAALSTLEQLLKDENKMTEDQLFTTLFYKSTVQLSQHNFNQALTTGNKALKMNDRNSGIYGVLVDANVEIGNYDEAVKLCDKMLQIRPDLRSYSRTSYLREIYGDLPGSKTAMMSAIEAGAPFSEYKCWSIITLGNIYESQGELDSAKICYSVALEEREKYPFAIAGQARVEGKKGNFAKAEQLYEQALKIVPEIGFNIELARLKKAQGKSQEVKSSIAEIETMFKEDIESGHNMSLEYGYFVLEFKNDYKKALSFGLEELKNRPNNIDVNKLLALSYFGLNNEKMAKKHLAIAMKTSKRDADLMCLDGLIKKDIQLVRSSFALNPYQHHNFVSRAKKFAFKNTVK
jgi:tetratricopeptide (TPR) repeat protein